MPPTSLEQEGSDWCSELADLLATREKEIRAKFREKGTRFLGRQSVLEQSPFATPDSVERRRGLNPQVASIDKWRRVEALERLTGFVKAYRAALKRFVSGDRLTMFPAGTYWMRFHLGVLCHEP